MISVGVPCDYGRDQEIDWCANPTYNGYKEWTWQLNRHHELKMLAHEYNRTKNIQWAKLAAELFESWVKQAVCPGDVSGYATECWRTIECGIRMGANWPYVLFTFFNTEPFTDEVLIHWCSVSLGTWKSFVPQLYPWQLADRGNEWTGTDRYSLSSVPAVCHVAGDSVYETLSGTGQADYPDGFQYELSTGYHDVVINNYQRLMEVAKAFDVPIPSEMINPWQLHVKLI